MTLFDAHDPSLFGQRRSAIPEPDIGRGVAPDGTHLPVLEPTGDIDRLLAQGTDIQAVATSRGIHNVFDDGGYKELLMLNLFNLRKLHREGDDAEDAQGRRYEMKTVARVSSSGKRKVSLSVTTEHTLTQANIERYRATFLWIVAVFDQSVPEVIYEIPPAKLEPYFALWEAKLASQGQSVGGAPNHLNNPKIPLKYIASHGAQVWPKVAPTHRLGGY
ncbi:hypothetical protein AB0A95_29590 [Micromonospora sp. NPDC049230]|uniref:hypothetical protein n=1 Tax=Micromonospora sp. NPDC049230 TaxID=3155502 RepID=UPI0033ED2379